MHEGTRPNGGLRVAHVIYYLGIGGGEVFLAALAPILAAAGVIQSVYCIGPAGPLAARLEQAGIGVRALNKTTRLGVRTVRRLAAALRRARPDVVQLHGEGGLIWGLPAARLAGCHRTAALVYQTAPDRWWKTAVERRLLPRAATVIAGSAAIRRFAIDRLGTSPERTCVIPCGIDVDDLVRHVATCRARDQPFRSHRPPVAVTVGRLVKRKGHEIAIRAVALATRALPDLELHIVGDGPERQTLEREAARCGISSRVRLRGTVWPTAAVLADADVFLFPSLDEPQGLAPLEAAAAGVPVIASAVGGIPEMFEDGRTSRLIPPGDPVALADAVVAMLRDDEGRRTIVEAAREMVRTFDVRAIAPRYLAHYDAMIGGEPCL